MKNQITAYDYRRAIALVQVLAAYDDWGTVNSDGEAALKQLCREWNVPIVCLDENGIIFDEIGTITELAKHTLEYSREAISAKKEEE